MYKQLKIKVTSMAVLFIILSSLFLCKNVNAVTSDDGPDVSDSSIDWKLTCFSDGTLGTGFKSSDFSTNEKYGWCEYEKDGVKYVVLAAATHELLNSGEIGEGRHDYIHYFNYYDTIQFKFVDEEFDNNTYNGIILDSCGASMYPPNYGHADNVQILDVYFSSSTYNEKISGQHVRVTMDGTFAESAGTSAQETIGEFFRNLAIKACQGVGDGIQKLINSAINDTEISDDKILYSRAEIEADEDLNNIIQVEDAVAMNEENVKDSDKEKYNTIRHQDVESTADNKHGIRESIYNSTSSIPVIPVDIYSATIGDIKFFDIDFFNPNNQNDWKFWKALKEVVTVASRMVLYISAAALLVMIIFRSILFVGSTIRGNPAGAYESRRIMDSIIESVLLIGSIYLILTIITYAYNEIKALILNGNTSMNLIRVNVENIYSFNTNLIGYIKFANSTINGSFKDALIYAIAEVINLLCVLSMFLRMLIVAILIVIAPITAVYTMVTSARREGENTDSIFRIGRFIRLYAIVLFLPLGVALIMKMMIIYI